MNVTIIIGKKKYKVSREDANASWKRTVKIWSKGLVPVYFVDPTNPNIKLVRYAKPN